MKKVIIYGIFDGFHNGHLCLLKKAKSLGDYLIVGIANQKCIDTCGLLQVEETEETRIRAIEQSQIADEIIVLKEGLQIADDIQKYHVDVLAVEKKWSQELSGLKKYCRVAVMENSPDEVSENRNLRIGIVGSGRIAARFVTEAKYVNQCFIQGVFSRNVEHAHGFASKFQLDFYTDSYSKLLECVDAVYVATSHDSHFTFIQQALETGKHVLGEKPLCLSAHETSGLYALARKNKVVLLEAIKTAYCPGFRNLLSMDLCEKIGKIVEIKATFTKLVKNQDQREWDPQEGGSLTELGSYPLLAVIKLLGIQKYEINVHSFIQNNVDAYTRIFLHTDHVCADLTVGIGAKSEGELIIVGTDGYVYIPAPWWKTECFEIRYEKLSSTEKYESSWSGDGLRYEINEWIHVINQSASQSEMLLPEESVEIAKVMETVRNEIKKKLVPMSFS